MTATCGSESTCCRSWKTNNSARWRHCGWGRGVTRTWRSYARIRVTHPGRVQVQQALQVLSKQPPAVSPPCWVVCLPAPAAGAFWATRGRHLCSALDATPFAVERRLEGVITRRGVCERGKRRAVCRVNSGRASDWGVQRPGRKAVRVERPRLAVC